MVLPHGGGSRAVVGTRSCPNHVQIVFHRGRSLGMTELRNCVKGSYASHTRVVLSSRVRIPARGSWYCVGK